MKGCLSPLNLKPRAEGMLQPDGPPPEFLESDCPLPCPCNHPLQEGVVLERTSGSKEKGSQHPRDPGIDRGTGKQCQAQMEKSRSSDLKVLCVPGHWSAGKDSERTGGEAAEWCLLPQLSLPFLRDCG